MTRGNGERVESVDAALLVEDSFVELSERDFTLLRAALNRLFVEKYRRKMRSGDDWVVRHAKRVMRESSELEDDLRRLHRRLQQENDQ